MFSQYREFLERYVSLNFIEWRLIRSKLKTKTYQKGEIIHNIGDVYGHLMFINYGLARGYIIDENGKDVTWSIFFNDKNAHATNLLVVDYESFLNRSESKLEIVALEETQIVMTEHKDIEFIYNHTKKGDRIGRLLAQEAYIYLHNFIIRRQTTTAKERFEAFVEETPHLLNKVPQYHIATLLGITPQHLSRLKKELC